MAIRKLLVANRGEIAARVFRTCRRLGIGTVAVHAPDDEGAFHTRQADEAVPVAGYLSAEALVRAAQETGADAVHPGYGFLAENGEFAEAVGAAGLVFVGPPPEAIRAAGDKLEAKRLAREAAAAAAAGEAEAGLGDGRVFCERYVERPRHVEIQLLADRHGAAIHLGERDCSVQRRHQKVLEESPSPALDPELRAAMGAAAVAFARAVGYENAGTAEFMLSGEEFFFLELNARLQVEHPVTELVTGLDLVEQQLRVAAGERLGLESREEAGHAVPVAYDPLIAKVIAGADTREEAFELLSRALRETRVGGVTTNLGFLRWLVDHPEVRAGRTTTAFLSQNPPLSRFAEVAPPWRVSADAVPLRPPPRVEDFAHGEGGAGVKSALVAPMPGVVIRVLAGEGDRVEPRQPLVVLEAMKMETPLVSPYEAVVRRVHVAEGDRVTGGTLLVELEE